MPDQFWKVSWEPPEVMLVVNIHFCAKCGCIGPCECWLKQELARMRAQRAERKEPAK